MYRVPVSSVDGKTITMISAVGLPSINDDISEVNVATLTRQVGLNPREIRRGSGLIDLPYSLLLTTLRCTQVTQGRQDFNKMAAHENRPRLGVVRR